jgi:hypothetical protein
MAITFSFEETDLHYVIERFHICTSVGANACGTAMT